MPTYEYLCGKCGKFEEIQSIKAQALAICPACHGPVTRIITGGGGIIFKGSGFYQTDNRSSDYKAREKADNAPATPAPAPDSGSGSKTEPKPVTKPAESAPAKNPAPTTPAPLPSKPGGGEPKSSS